MSYEREQQQPTGCRCEPGIPPSWAAVLLEPCPVHEPAYAEDGVELWLGDVLDVLPRLEAESVNCIVTSPPFWGLRSYAGCPPSVWGGDPNCPHTLEAEPMHGEGYTDRRRWQHEGVSRQETGDAWVSESRPGISGGTAPSSLDGDRSQASSPGSYVGSSEHATCSRCGAWKGWLGLEPEADCMGWARGEECSRCYLCHLRVVLRLLWRVLRKDGVLWLDIGDSRGNPTEGGFEGSTLPHDSRKTAYRPASMVKVKRKRTLTAKNLMLIPDRLCLAMQADGWIVRSKVVIRRWMPESAKDRPTDDYRELIMATKQGRYWYDGQAVRVPIAGSYGAPRPVGGRAREASGDATMLRGSYPETPDDRLRNLGALWTDIPPASSALPGKHFAAYHEAEPERCIKASCPAEVCVKCGKARVRIVAKGLTAHDGKTASELPKGSTANRLSLLRQAARERGSEYVDETKTMDWTDCGCGVGWRPGVVIDPFAGTATTLVAARALGRRCVGVEASEEFMEGAITRLRFGRGGVRAVERGQEALL